MLKVVEKLIKNYEKKEKGTYRQKRGK